MENKGIPADWPELPMLVYGADIFVKAGESRLPRARYISCRIYVINGTLDDVGEWGMQMFECEIVNNSAYNPYRPPPPRPENGFVGNRGGKVISLVKGRE